MQSLFESCHANMLNVMEKGNYIFIDKDQRSLLREAYNEEQLHRYLLNGKAYNIFMCQIQRRIC